MSSSSISPSNSSLSSTPPPPLFLRTPYNYYPSAVSLETALFCDDPSLTRQDDAEDADINVIVGRFLKTGLLPENVRVPQYGDFSQASDYKSSLDQVRRAEQAFAEFPAEVRAQFNHDVGAFLDAAYAGQVSGVNLDKQTQPAAAEAPSGASVATGDKPV